MDSKYPKFHRRIAFSIFPLVFVLLFILVLFTSAYSYQYFSSHNQSTAEFYARLVGEDIYLSLLTEQTASAEQVVSSYKKIDSIDRLVIYTKTGRQFYPALESGDNTGDLRSLFDDLNEENNLKVLEDSHSWTIIHALFSGIDELISTPFARQNSEKELIGYLVLEYSKKHLTDFRLSLAITIGLISLLCSAVIAVLIVRLTRNLTQPLEQLSKRLDNTDLFTTEEASESYKVNTQEIDVIGRSYEAMQLRLQEQAHTLDEKNRELADKIVRLQQLEKDKEELREQLYSAKKSESVAKLVGSLAHDFNNMLTSILGYNHLARNIAKTLKNDKLSDYLDNLAQAGNKAQHVTNQLIEFNQAEKRRLTSKQFFYRTNLDVLIHSVNDKMLEPQIKYVTKSFLDQQRFNINPEVLSQLLGICHQISQQENKSRSLLLTLHEHDGGDISHTCQFCQQQIPAYTYIIELEFAVTQETANELLTVNTLINVENGRNSQEKSVLNPISKLHSDYCHFSFSLNSENHTACLQIFIDKQLEVSGKMPTATTKNILLVDDEVSIATLLTQLLSNNGYSVTTVADAFTAQQLVLKNPKAWDLIITDNHMPVTSGIEMLEQLKQTEIPAIVCGTDIISEAESLMLHNRNIKDTLSKPVQPHQLLDSIQHIFSADTK